MTNEDKLKELLKSCGNIISIAKKFGMRKEEIPVLVKTCSYRDGNHISGKLLSFYVLWLHIASLHKNVGNRKLKCN